MKRALVAIESSLKKYPSPLFLQRLAQSKNCGERVKSKRAGERCLLTSSSSIATKDT